MLDKGRPRDRQAAEAVVRGLAPDQLAGLARTAALERQKDLGRMLGTHVASAAVTLALFIAGMRMLPTAPALALFALLPAGLALTLWSAVSGLVFVLWPRRSYRDLTDAISARCDVQLASAALSMFWLIAAGPYGRQRVPLYASLRRMLPQVTGETTRPADRREVWSLVSLLARYKHDPDLAIGALHAIGEWRVRSAAPRVTRLARTCTAGLRQDELRVSAEQCLMALRSDAPATDNVSGSAQRY